MCHFVVSWVSFSARGFGIRGGPHGNLGRSLSFLRLLGACYFYDVGGFAFLFPHPP